MSISASIFGNAVVQDTTTGYGPSQIFSPATNANLIAYSYLTNESIPTSPTSITFPFGVTKLQFLFIRNLGSQSLQVTWTPSGGGSVVVTTLTAGSPQGTPGGMIMLYEPDLTLGVTALSLQAITAGTIAQIIMAG
jgi:hypothetical protein